MDIRERVSKLRNYMQENKIDAFIVPSNDNHLSEYVGEYFKCREWISGFTGSAGTVLITLDQAHLFVDGRYHIQADNEVLKNGYVVHKLGKDGEVNYIEWIAKNLKDGQTVGFNGKVIAIDTLNSLKEKTNKKRIQFLSCEDVFSDIWEERPNMPCGQLFLLKEEFCGESVKSKINKVIEEMRELGGDYFVLSSLDDIAWVLNLRGSDVPCNPVFLSYLLINENGCNLYIDNRKLKEDILEYLKINNIKIHGYSEIKEHLCKIKESDTVLYDESKTSVWIDCAINENVKRINERNITTNLKGIKNEVEIKNLKNCEIRDGIAMVKFIYWLKSNIGKIEIDEFTAAEKLNGIRKNTKYNLGISFNSISAYGANAAMMHYTATDQKKTQLKDRGFYLIDSGGQYYDGTTDITRTIALGDLTVEEKLDFTLVLKGHIGLSKAIFLSGTTGSSLDILARKPIWERAIDYKCGTGHGVGFLLNVHEGPHSISKVLNSVELKEGMIVTNEPGIYKEGKHGIRTENILLVKEFKRSEFGKFLCFETISYCPIDIDAIIPDMLDSDEKEWLNSYHRMVFDKLKEGLEGNELEWLKNATREI